MAGYDNWDYSAAAAPADDLSWQQTDNSWLGQPDTSWQQADPWKEPEKQWQAPPAASPKFQAAPKLPAFISNNSWAPSTTPDYSVPDYSVPDFSVPDYSVPAGDYSMPDFTEPEPTNVGLVDISKGKGSGGWGDSGTASGDPWDSWEDPTAGGGGVGGGYDGGYNDGAGGANMLSNDWGGNGSLNGGGGGGYEESWDYGKSNGKGNGKWGSGGGSFSLGVVAKSGGWSGDTGKGKSKGDKGKGKKGKTKNVVVPPPPGVNFAVKDTVVAPPEFRPVSQLPMDGYKGGKGGTVMPPMGGPAVVPPPPGGFIPMVPPGGTLKPLALMPPPGLVPPPVQAIAPELAALMEMADGHGKKSPLQPHVIEKKPRLVLLVTMLPSDLEETHMQQILEQCGDVQAWRRGRGPNGEPLSFGFAQFGDPEEAWKVMTCLSKKVVRGQELKVLMEEQTESIVQQWRASQREVLKLTTDEELEWELERKSVSCKALIDAKVEELLGPSEAAAGPDDTGAGIQRMQELREREQSRVERTRKRKAWREAEFTKELSRIVEVEERQRREETDKDLEDRDTEDMEAKSKEAHEERLAKMEETIAQGGSLLDTASADDVKSLYDLVNRVQAEPTKELYKIPLDVTYLRDEKIFEKKLRPWLDRKIDLSMGGSQSDLTEYVLRRVNAATPADALISDLGRFLDEDADSLVERMYRMLILELTRAGLGLQKKPRLE